MEKFFRYLGHKAGPSIRKGKWIYHSFFADKEQAIESEYLVGKELSIKMSADHQMVNNEEITKLLAEMNRKLCNCLTNKKRKFEFNIIASKDVNAFALPGGFIYMTDGLLKLCDFSHDQLAYVFSHEMMHVILKHPLNRMLSSFSLQVLEKFIRTKGAVGSLAKQAISSFIRNGYSQEKELEADKYGVQLLSLAGYKSQAAIDVLQKLNKSNSEKPDIFNYFSSHPPVVDRIAHIRQHFKV
jgi:predicted Zn-dependent protease